MKKLIIVCILFSGIFLGQNRPRPGIDYMMHTGFFDFVINALHHPRGGNSNDLISNYTNKGWYFDKLRELGLTNLVTDGMYNLSIQNNSNNIFLLNDMGFAWKHDPGFDTALHFKPAEFMRALGHVDDSYPLEFGGTTAPTIAPDKNFGFTVAGSDATCYWGMRDEYKPAYLETTGQDINDNTASGTHRSRRSQYGTHDEGVMLWGMIPWTQLADPRLKYKMRIYLRIADNDTSKEMDGIGVYAGPFSASLQDQPQIERRRDFFTEPELIPVESMGISQVFKNNELPESDDYYWIETNSFNVSQNMNLAFHIYWSGNLTVYIDKITFVSEEFDRLYVNTSGPVLMDSIFTELDSIYPSSVYSNQRFQSFYFDEPFQLSAEYRKDLQAEVFSKSTSNNNLEINGATGAVPGYFHYFDIKWAAPTANRLKNYLLYNLYPIGSGTTYSQDHVQAMLNTFVNYRNFNDGGTGPYQYSGLRSAQLGAQRYNQDETDDIPLVMTLGVHAEQYVVGVDNSAHIVPGVHSRRAPTYDEIFAQGNLSLAYGAKGFMYYMVPTRANSGTAQDPSWNTYGLFDDETAVYDSSNSGTGLVQDPAENQIPNHRFYAVRDFIASTSLVDSVLLKLRWLDAKGWNRTESCSINIIDSVKTRNPFVTSNVWDAVAYVETGYFEEINPSSDDIVPPNYIYVVNKRCNKQEIPTEEETHDYSHRYVSLKFNLDSDYKNYTIHDLKTDSVYYIGFNGLLVLYLEAGHGTLLKIEPTIQSGGTLGSDETVNYNINVKGNVKLAAGKTLTITNGADMKFLNSSKLDVSSANLYIFTTGTGSAKLDFVSRNWTAGNGIIASGANVSINNAIIKNASTAIAAWNPASLSISNSTIENCWFGVSVESRPVGSIYLDNVKVVGCSERGVTLGTANLEIKNSRNSG
ncbi:MAG: hypothetical protein F9K14_19405, partial [Candidatus Methanoperedens sp.]